MLDARERAHRAVDEVAGRIARDLLDLVAQPLHRPVAVARAAVDGAGDAVDERAQHRLVGPQPGRAQAGRDAHREHLRLERDAHHVVRAGVERLAQLVRGVEVGADDDVHAGQLRARADRVDQRRCVPRAGHHDLSGAVGDHADRRGGLGDPQQAQPGGGQHRPRIRAELLQPEHQHAVALTDEPVEGAGGTPHRGAPGPRHRLRTVHRTRTFDFLHARSRPSFLDPGARTCIAHEGSGHRAGARPDLRRLW